MSSENATPLIALHSASAHYGDQQVLEAINFRIHRGERIVILGKSGAGKSTLLSILHDKLNQQGETLSWLPQQHGLVDNLSVFHNILMGQIDQRSRWFNLLNLLWPQSKPRQEISQLLDSLELGGLLFTPVAELSGGQQQRVAIGRALYRHSSLLLADEAISNLDKPLARRMLELMSKRFNGYLLTLHDTDLAMDYADRIIGIKNGRILMDCATQKINDADIQRLYQDEQSN